MRASERAYATLLDEIQSGVLPAGTVLGEVEQAARLGVSRTPLRAALGRLVADGLVIQASPRVTVVSDIDAQDIHALFVVRRALEETAARVAATRVASAQVTSAQCDPAVFQAFADEFAAASLEGDRARDDYYDIIARFDRAIDAAADNDYLTQALRTVRTHLVRVRRLARYNPERLAQSVAEHRLIASAIAAGDADLAATATHVHLHHALANIVASLDAHAEHDAPATHALAAS